MQAAMQLRSIIMAFFVLGCQSSEINITENKTSKTGLQTSPKFDPYGYYLPKDDVFLDGYSFEWLFIPGKSDTPSIRLGSKKTNIFLDIKASHFSINGKQGLFEFSDSKETKISMRGQFLGEKGPSEDQVKSNKTVFQGTITIKGIQNPISMTWFEGD